MASGALALGAPFTHGLARFERGYAGRDSLKSPHCPSSLQPLMLVRVHARGSIPEGLGHERMRRHAIPWRSLRWRFV